MSILDTQLANNNLSQAYIFEGSDPNINLDFAKNFAKEVFAKKGLDLNFQRDPDFYIIDKDNDIIDIKTIRMITKDISLKPRNNLIKMYIIHNAQNLRDEGSNALLKTLEELKPYNIIVFTSTNSDLILKTIRSRCQIVRLSSDQITKTINLEKLSSIIKDVYRTDISSFYQNKDFFDGYRENREELFDVFLTLFNLILRRKYSEENYLSDELEFNISYLIKMNFEEIEKNIALLNKIKTGLRTNINYDLSVQEVIFNIYKGGMQESERSWH